jgi:hypothetical protein
MADPAYLITKFLHVAAAMVWLGFAAYEGYIHFPALKRLEGVDRVKAFRATQARTGIVLTVVGAFTVLVGFEVARQLYGSMNPVEWWSHANPGAAWVTVASGLGLAALVVTLLGLPLGTKLAAIENEPFEADTQDRLRSILARLTMVYHTMVLLLVVVLFLMVGANTGGVS